MGNLKSKTNVAQAIDGLESKIDDRVAKLEDVIDSLSGSYDAATATHISANVSAFNVISDDDVAGLFANVYCDKIGN